MPSGRAAPDVAAVIVNWNTREQLGVCLASLRPPRQRRLSRTIVVDNASRDGSAAMVADGFPEVNLLEPGRNTGYAAGNNLALRSATEQYVLLLNPDTELPEGAVDQLAGFLDHHPAAGAVAPQLILPDGSVQRSCRGFPTPPALLAELCGLSLLAGFLPSTGAYRLLGWNHDSERQVDQPMTSALMVRHAAIQQVGLFDEQFPLFFNDVDWLYRMKQAGWETWFTPSVRVQHHHGASTRQIPLRAAWLSHRALHTYYRKHYRKALGLPLYGLIVAGIYLRLVGVASLRALKLSRPRLCR